MGLEGVTSAAGMLCMRTGFIEVRFTARPATTGSSRMRLVRSAAKKPGCTGNTRNVCAEGASTKMCPVFGAVALAARLEKSLNMARFAAPALCILGKLKRAKGVENCPCG